MPDEQAKPRIKAFVLGSEVGPMIGGQWIEIDNLDPDGMHAFSVFAVGVFAEGKKFPESLTVADDSSTENGLLGGSTYTTATLLELIDNVTARRDGFLDFDFDNQQAIDAFRDEGTRVKIIDDFDATVVIAALVGS